MLFIKNLPFVNVTGNGVASVSLPVGMSYNRILLKLGGGLNKANITRIRVKLNGKAIDDMSGARLEAVNAYRNRAQNASFMILDFVEPDAKTMAEQLVGNINTASGVSSFTIEVTISGADGGVTLDSFSELAPPRTLGRNHQENRIHGGHDRRG